MNLVSRLNVNTVRCTREFIIYIFCISQTGGNIFSRVLFLASDLVESMKEETAGSDVFFF
jgi:hypothetical protein